MIAFICAQMRQTCTYIPKQNVDDVVSSSSDRRIELDQDKRDLKCKRFKKFLLLYNGISLNQHKIMESVLDLDDNKRLIKCD